MEITKYFNATQIMKTTIYLVRFGGAGACLPFLFVERLICTILLFPLFERPPINVLNLVTELVDSKIYLY